LELVYFVELFPLFLTSILYNFTLMPEWFVVSYDLANKQKHYKKPLH